jgi:hypothetical protein
METTIATFIAEYSLNDFQQLLSAFVSHDDFYFTFSPFLYDDDEYETSDEAFSTIADDYDNFIGDDGDENRKEFVKSQIETLFALRASENTREKLTKFIWTIKNDAMRPLYELRCEEDEELPLYDEIEYASELAIFESEKVRNEALRIAFL